MSQAIDQDADHPVNPTFDPLDPDYLSDPYPYFARFRETPVFYAPKIDFWVVSRYEGVQNRGPKELWAEWRPGKSAPVPH